MPLRMTPNSEDWQVLMRMQSTEWSIHFGIVLVGSWKTEHTLHRTIQQIECDSIELPKSLQCARNLELSFSLLWLVKPTSHSVQDQGSCTALSQYLNRYTCLYWDKYLKDTYRVIIEWMAELQLFWTLIFLRVDFKLQGTRSLKICLFPAPRTAL